MFPFGVFVRIRTLFNKVDIDCCLHRIQSIRVREHNFLVSLTNSAEAKSPNFKKSVFLFLTLQQHFSSHHQQIDHLHIITDAAMSFILNLPSKIAYAHIFALC